MRGVWEGKEGVLSRGVGEGFFGGVSCWGGGEGRMRGRGRERERERGRGERGGKKPHCLRELFWLIDIYLVRFGRDNIFQNMGQFFPILLHIEGLKREIKRKKEQREIKN